ncbi:MAG: aminotransferase class I/II-fold pyridoxal phosphate-dependent enzyme [Lachnospiraceae bacterium]|nr:aminotransferase class I/II-fold pyridoxal phosphate-dependent enzyme [Lachnospiraceae bacterium]
MAVPNLGGNEKKYLDNCIDTTFVSSVGEYVTRMEDMCKEACGSEFAVATSSGTTALHSMLLSVGVGRDDLVILPTFTFIASANAIAHCGALPWLFDINDDWVLDAAQVKAALETECSISSDGQVTHTPTGRRVAAIMPVYTLGNIPECPRFGESRMNTVCRFWRMPPVRSARPMRDNRSVFWQMPPHYPSTGIKRSPAVAAEWKK